MRERDFQIQFERQLQTLIPGYNTTTKLNSDTIFSYINRAKDEYVKQLYRVFQQNQEITDKLRTLVDKTIYTKSDFMKTGKKSYLWADYQEWKAMREWYKRCERMLVYMKNNVNKDGSCNLKGTNGRPVFIGAGLLEQIAPSNRRYYTELTAELLEDFLFDLSYNVLGTNERKFVALTGEMGMREFDRILKEKVVNMNLIDTVFVTGSGDNLTFGGQFKTFKMTNGIELTLKYFPLYDDLMYNRKLHPVTKKPLESYRMTFLDLGRRDGEANIVKVVRKDREFVTWTTGGAVLPSGYGKSINTLRSNGKDGYTVYFLGEMGIMLRDPRACGELIMEAE